MMSPKVKLRSGQTLVLTGFEENSENATKSGVGDPGFFGFGRQPCPHSQGTAYS